MNQSRSRFSEWTPAMREMLERVVVSMGPLSHEKMSAVMGMAVHSMRRNGMQAADVRELFDHYIADYDAKMLVVVSGSN